MQENQKPLLLIQDLGYMFPKEMSKQKKRFGIYQCQCGVEFIAQTGHVKNVKTQSCGCYRKQRGLEANTKHGLNHHRLYPTWNAMIQRTSNSTNKAYKNYGARGITVCERWLDITNFIKDMYQSYAEGLSIDRIDNDKGYSPDNCRWTTRVMQGRNTRILISTNTSGFRGVSFHKARNKWASYIRVNGKGVHIGLFSTALEAAKAYDAYVIENKLEHTINGVLK